MEIECIGDIDLKDINAQYRLLFECALDIIFLLDLNGNILNVNHRAVKSYGYTKDEILAMNARDLRMPMERDLQQKQFNEAYTKGEVYETVHQRKNGSTFPVEVSARGVNLDDKKMLVAIVRDITKRKEYEKNLSRIAAIVESSDDAIIGMTPGGIITDWNYGAEKIYDYTAKDVIGRSIAILIPKDREGELSHILSTIKNNGHIEHFDTMRLKKDGTSIHVSLTASPVNSPGGELLGISWTARDITERKKIEDAFRESERVFRGIYEQAPLGIALIDSITGRFLHINPKYVQIIGRTEEEMQKISFKDISYPDDLMEDLDNMAKLFTGEIKFFNMKKRLFRGDGSITWVNLTVVPLWEDKEREYPKVHIAMVEDITRQKQAEEALESAKAQSEMYLDLMGHDINNMNMVALGYLELTLNKLRSDKKIDEDVIGHLSRSITTLNNVSKLISNVRIIQQVKGGMLEVRVVDIGMMLAEVVYEYRNIPGREVIINYKPVKGYFVKTCELFKDVFTNLVGNAIKHSSGPLVINIEIEKVREDDTDYYKISVEDNGPGIPDNRKSEIFKPHKPGEAKAKRIGVGLILVRTLVEDFKGKIWVEDRIPGDYTRGARFVVMLPAVEK